jgi:hypothetical protein
MMTTGNRDGPCIWATSASLFARKVVVMTEGVLWLIGVVKSNAQHYEDRDQHRPFQPV